MPKRTHKASRPRFTPIRITLTLTIAIAAGACSLATAAPAAIAATTEPCPNQTVREQQHASYLPDCRAYEQVTPAQKNGGEVNPPVEHYSGAPYHASMEGAGIAYEADEAFPGSLSSGLADFYLSDSELLGSPWQTLPLNPDNRLGILPSRDATRDSAEFNYFSPNLTCGIEKSELPLTALPAGETPEEDVLNTYVWNAAANTYTLVTNIKQESGRDALVDGASADCSHVIFESDEFPSLSAKVALYEWEPGHTPRAASVLPDGTLPEGGVERNSGGEAGSNLGEISSDGSRVFFTAEADGELDEEYEEVFMRLDGTSTAEVSAAKTGIADSGARFQAASKNGEHVFFTANYGLTATSSMGETRCNKETGRGCDLYDYDTATGTLTDISADVDAAATGDSTGADVAGVLGIAEEGDVVYFSAAGQLVPGEGNTEEHDEEAGEANVYAYSDGQLTYVTSIGAAEAGDANREEEEIDAIATNEHGLTYTVSRVSSTGGYLLFATSKQIRQSDGTTYDNIDAVSGDADFEEYEYSLAAGTVTCVSCDPSGAQPRLAGSLSESHLFVHEGEYGQFEEVVDGYMPQNLADDGEVFFQTTNPVLPQAINDTFNVYEWDPEGVGSCPPGQSPGCVAILDSGVDANASYFDGASANGENVYVTTYAKLAPEDEDGLRDIYDVRTEGGFLLTPPAECKGEECQGPLPTPEGVPTPASALGGVNGNFPLQPLNSPPAISSTAAVAIVSKKVKGDTVVVSVKMSEKGRVRISGKYLKTTSKTIAAGTHTITVALTKAGRVAMKRHMKTTLRVSLTVGKQAVAKTTTVKL